MSTIELLAPARDADCGIAAITCGADAVYIGAERFGAREAAGNSLPEIARLVRYAHRYWANVYVTLNTILHDDEIPLALRLIAELYDIGVDALIIQDVGLLECDLPPIPLIASTQMHNSTPEKIAFLEQVGFQRAILARELSLEQIQAIRAQTTLELECFVHGALCVCYSGQCYLSYAIGGRSGNRGQCAQPCRRSYTLLDSQGNMLAPSRHWLSLKDLDRANYLRELIEAGVTSFKIEGRLKDQAYVMNMVSYYRQKLDPVLRDLMLKKRSSGNNVIDFAPNPLKTFNRGYTTYFLTGREPNMASYDTPKSLGEPLGEVQTVDARSFTLAFAAPIHNGDGICFFDRQKVLQGTVVNTVQGNRVYPDKMADLEAGTLIYRNYDHAFIRQLNNSKAARQIAVNMTFTDVPEGFRLTAVDEDGNVAEETLICEKSPARNADAALVNVRKQVQKCGGTEFMCTDVRITWEMPYFLPVAVFNELRRNVLAKLSTVRADNRPIRRANIVKNSIPFPEHQLSYRGNVFNSHAEAFYRRHGVTQIQPAAETGLDLHGHVVMTTKYCLKYEFGICPKQGVSEDFAEPLYLIDEYQQVYALRFHCDTCEMEILFGKQEKL